MNFSSLNLFFSVPGNYSLKLIIKGDYFLSFSIVIAKKLTSSFSSSYKLDSAFVLRC